MDNCTPKNSTETIFSATVGGTPIKREIKRCPFCGGSARLKMLTSGPEDKGRVAYVCTVCGASGPVMRFEDYENGMDIAISKDAEKAWNMRAYK